MMFRPSDRALHRWLETGRPRRIERLLDGDPDLAARVDSLTELSEAESDALEALVSPAQEFERRVETGVQRRIEALETLSTMVDLLGLGFHTGRAVLGEPWRQSGPTGGPAAAEE